MDIKKSKEKLSKLYEAIDLISRYVDEQTKQHVKVIAAELKSRFFLLHLYVLLFSSQL